MRTEWHTKLTPAGMARRFAAPSNCGLMSWPTHAGEDRSDALPSAPAADAAMIMQAAPCPAGTLRARRR